MTEFRAQPGPQERFLRSPADIAVYGGSAGSGKLLRLDEPIPTPSGWRLNGQLKAGDMVFDELGFACRVVTAYEPEVPQRAYRLTFDDGMQIECGEDHQWLTYSAKELGDLTKRDTGWREARRSRRKSKIGGNKSARFTAAIIARNKAIKTPTKPAPAGTIRTAGEIAVTLLTRSGRRNHAILTCCALELDNSELPIDPYVLGVWLGDGTSSNGNITCADAGIIAALIEHGQPMRKMPSAPYGWNSLGLAKQLTSVGLRSNKHVPAEYLWASKTQRLELLYGLMDTDGYAGKEGAVEFCNTNRNLASAVLHIVLSLGEKATLKEGRATLYGKDCGPKYRVCWTPKINPFLLARKSARIKKVQRRTNRFRYIISAKEVEPSPMRCISVDSPSRLYLASHAFIPTHNSYGLLLDTLRYVKDSRFGAVIFRRTTPQIASEGGLWDESEEIYPSNGGTGYRHAYEWRFESGAKVKLAHMEYEKNRFDWMGAQIPYLAFDELTTFEESQFWYLMGRNRSPAGIKTWIRATCNPDPDSFVRKLIDWWIDNDTGYPIKERSGILRWFIRINNELIWDDHRSLLVEKYGKEQEPKSVTFIPARITDNQILLRKDPAYLSNLKALPYVDRMQLLEGNWNVRPAAGLYFKQHYFGIVDAVPEGIRTVRTWDLAATEKTKGNEPDWTVGLKVGRDKDGIFYISDVRRLQESPHGVERAILNTASLDGRLVEINIPQDPGQAGKHEAHYYLRLLAGHTVRTMPVIRDKVTRAKPASSQAEAKNIKLLRGPWNESFLNELENFPKGANDDQVDALSDAIQLLTTGAGEFRAIAIGDRFERARTSRRSRSL